MREGGRERQRESVRERDHLQAHQQRQTHAHNHTRTQSHTHTITHAYKQRRFYFCERKSEREKKKEIHVTHMCELCLFKREIEKERERAGGRN